MTKFKKKPKGEGRGEWSEEYMKHAVAAVLENKMSERAASQQYNVPRSTLQRKIKAISDNQQTDMKPQLGYFKATFNDEYEAQLVEYMKDLDSRLMPLSKSEFLKLAYDLAENLGLKHRFNIEKKMAGKDFYISFMKRHPELSYRKPQSTSLMRCVGFNKPQVERFFNQLKTMIEKHKFRPSRIFNADETGVSSVHENEKVITMKGKRQVGKMTSGERGRNVSLMFCMSATGQFIPPLFIFPRVRMNNRLMIGAPAESISFATPNGWMTKDSFLKWLQHFVSVTKPSKEDPVLLIIDGHRSHKDLDVILYARENYIHMLSFPPHTTHKLQPLDRTFMKPFKNFYNAACSSWMRANPGLRINDYDIAKLVADAYKKVCRLDIAENGFKCTGIYPTNSQIFSDSDFMGSDITNIAHQSLSDATSEDTATTASEISSGLSAARPNCLNSSSLTTAVPPSSSTATTLTARISIETEATSLSRATSLTRASSPQLSSHQDNATASALVGFSPNNQTLPVNTNSPGTEKIRKPEFASVLKKFSPFPTCSEKRLTSRKRKSEKSEILTSSPVKNMLIAKKDEEKKKEATKQIKKQKQFAKPQTKLKQTKSNEKKGNEPRPRPKTKKAKVIDYHNPTPGSSKDKTDVDCVVCGESYEANWIQCKTCEGWAHELCAEIDDPLFYYCDYCKLNNK